MRLFNRLDHLWFVVHFKVDAEWRADDISQRDGDKPQSGVAPQEQGFGSPLFGEQLLRYVQLLRSMAAHLSFEEEGALGSAHERVFRDQMPLHPLMRGRERFAVNGQADGESIGTPGREHRLRQVGFERGAFDLSVVANRYWFPSPFWRIPCPAP